MQILQTDYEILKACQTSMSQLQNFLPLGPMDPFDFLLDTTPSNQPDIL